MSPPMGFRTFADPPGEEPPRARDDSRATFRQALVLAPGRLTWQSHLIVIAFAAAMLLLGLGGDLRVLTQHEVFAAETAREMLATGDGIMPRFAGVPRLNKPPGMYWLIAGSMWLFDSRAEWVARLPAALAGLLLCVVIARLTARFIGNVAGLIAGLMQASFVYVLMQARLAEADMPMALAVAIAFAAFASTEVIDGERPRGVRRLGLALIFGLAAGASVELKGVGVLFIYSGCLLWILATRRWRSLRFLVHPLALVALIAVAGFWPLAIYLRDPAILRVWRRETGGRFRGEFGDPEPWYTYFINVPYLVLPWAPFAIIAIVGWFRRGSVPTWHGFPTRASDAERERSGVLEYERASTSSARVGNPCHGWRAFAASLAAHPKAVFLACWFLGGMTLLMFSSAKHKHYAIPMLPPITIVSAAGFCQWLTVARRNPRAAWQKRIALTIVALAGAAGITLVQWKTTAARTGLTDAVIAITIGVSATVAAYAAAARRSTIYAAFGTALAAGLLFQFLVLPDFDDYKASAALARRADAIVPANQPILLVKLGEAHAAYYLDHPLIRIDHVQRRIINGVEEKQSDWEKFLRDNPAQTLYILCPRSAVSLLGKGEVKELDRVDHQRKVEKDLTVLVQFKR